MPWQSALIAALSARLELTNLWDTATDRQRQLITEVLIAAQQCGICIHHHGRVRYMNRCLQQVMGIALHDVHGQALTHLMADPASRRQSIQCIGSDEEHDYIVIMDCPTGELTVSAKSRPVTWYGEQCRVALLTPILTYESEREWVDCGEPVVIGETV